MVCSFFPAGAVSAPAAGTDCRRRAHAVAQYGGEYGGARAGVQLRFFGQPRRVRGQPAFVALSGERQLRLAVCHWPAEHAVGVSLLAVVAATLVGVVVGVLRVSRNWLLRQLAAVYVEVFRNIPLLLQLFFWYFAVLAVLPAPRASTLRLGCDEAGCLAVLSNRGLTLIAPLWQSAAKAALALLVVGIVCAWLLHRWNRRRQARSGQVLRLWWAYALLVVGLPLAAFTLLVEPSQLSRPLLQGFNFRGGVTLLPELMALWLALSLYSASYIAEYVRSGIASVPRGQYEAAEALGLPPVRVMRLVILPQALRVMVPPMTSQYLNIVKNSSLATAIAYPDLVSVFTGTALNQTGRAVEIIGLTMAVYLAISLLISLAMTLYNRRIRIVER